MVATEGVAETHGFVASGVPEPANCVVDPAQTLRPPAIVGTSTTTVAVTEQPRLLV